MHYDALVLALQSTLPPLLALHLPPSLALTFC
jgi:hypothetical protein